MDTNEFYQLQALTMLNGSIEDTAEILGVDSEGLELFLEYEIGTPRFIREVNNALQNLIEDDRNTEKIRRAQEKAIEEIDYLYGDTRGDAALTREKAQARREVFDRFQEMLPEIELGYIFQKAVNFLNSPEMYGGRVSLIWDVVVNGRTNARGEGADLSYFIEAYLDCNEDLSEGCNEFWRRFREFYKG